MVKVSVYLNRRVSVMTFHGKKENVINLSSAELAKRVVLYIKKPQKKTIFSKQQSLVATCIFVLRTTESIDYMYLHT